MTNSLSVIPPIIPAAGNSMKQPVFIAALIAFALIFTILPMLQGRAEAPDYTDDAAYPNFAGRLHIPEVGIDVALYRSNK